MNSKSYSASGNHDVLEKHHEVIVFIEGVLKEVRDADAHPHLNNPERKRRLAEEFEICVEKYIDLMDLLEQIYSRLLKENEIEEESKHHNNAKDTLLKAMLKLPVDNNLLNEELEQKKYAEKLIKEFDQKYKKIMPLLNEKINTYKTVLERINQHMQEQEKLAVEKYKSIYNNAPSHINTIAYDVENYFGNSEKTNLFHFDEKELFSAVSKVVDATFISERVLHPLTQGNSKENYAEENAVRNFLIGKAEKHVSEQHPNLDVIKKKECQKMIVDQAMKLMSVKRQEMNKSIDIVLREPQLEIMKTRAEHKLLSEELINLTNKVENLENTHIMISHGKFMNNKAQCNKVETVNDEIDLLEKMFSGEDVFLKNISPIFTNPASPTVKIQSENEPSLESHGLRR